MKRQVECQSKTVRVYAARGSTPDGGSVAPDVEKRDVVVEFYDAGELASHRNSYSIILTEKEAANYKVGEVYTLAIN